MNKTTMNKIPIFLLLILLSGVAFGKVNSYANANENVSKLKLNQTLKIDSDSKLFEVSGEGKNKTQIRIKDNKNDENPEFKIKGTISASTSNSITIDGKLINIDASVTEDIKIVGDIKVGAYAMVTGVVKDSLLYAEKIVVDQRNKKDIQEQNEKNATISATQKVALEKSEKGGVRESFNMKILLVNLRNILNSFRSFLLSV